MEVKFTDNSAAVLREFSLRRIQALEGIGAAAERHAKALTPVDTGRLRTSMSHAAVGDSAYIGTNVEYGPYVEFGTIHNKEAHHMIEKAATGHGAEYKAIAEAAFGK